MSFTSERCPPALPGPPTSAIYNLVSGWRLFSFLKSVCSRMAVMMMSSILGGGSGRGWKHSSVRTPPLHALHAPTHHIPSRDRISTTRKPQRGARQRRAGVCWPTATRPWPPGSPPAASCCFWVRATRTPRPPDGPQRRAASSSPAEERSLPRAQSPALSCPSSARSPASSPSRCR